MRGAIGLVVCAVLAAISLGAGAQPPGAPPRSGQSAGGGDTGRAGGTGADPLRFRQLARSAIREKLAPLDDPAWATLWPKIEKVLDAQRNARTGAALVMASPVMIQGNPPPHVIEAAKRARGGGAGASQAEIDTPAGRAMQQVRAALDQPATTDAELLARLADMRAARDVARAQLAAAQKDLNDACTPRQVAVLVTLGILE